LNYLKAMADVAASGANATVATSPTLSTTVATSPKLSAIVAKGQVDHLQNVTVTSSSTDAPVVNDQPGISSEAWLRSLGAANTTLNASTDPTTMGVAASMIDPLANNGLSVASKTGSKAKASAQSVESNAAVATDEPNLTLPNVTIVNAAKVLAGVAEKAQRPSDSPTGGALTSATAVDPTLASGSSLSATNAASSGSAVDQKAQELLNTPIELPQPDKSYAQRMDDFSAQVASRLMAQIKTEKYSINLKVTPENLGPIAISLTVDGNKLNAHFGAAVPEVNSLLKAALPNLKDNLESQGYNLGTTSFSQSGSGFGAAFGNQTSSGSNASAAVTSVKAASETVPDAPVSVEPSTHVLDVYA
jgi:flagellar hook-length control protein FliK